MAGKKFLNLNNGLIIPTIGLGTWRAPDVEVETALNLALEAGYRHIDAAPVYMNEPVIGRVLKSWIDSNKLKREDLFIATKLPPPAIRASCVEKFLRKSLSDLQLSYVDLYLIHTPFGVPEVAGEFLTHDNGDVVLDEDTDHVATWAKLEEMVEMGLTKSIGLSNFNKSQIQRILDNCKTKPVNLQIELHIYLQQNDLVDFCKRNDITVTAYAPLGSKGIGALTKAAGTERDLPDLMENSEILKIAEVHKKTPAQILLRWIIQRGVIPIPKSTNPQRLKDNLNIFDFELSPDELGAISKLDNNLRVCDFGFFQGMNKHPEFPFK